MSNYHPVNYDDASPELRAIYDDLLKNLKFSNVPNWALYLGQAPHILKGMVDMFYAVFFSGRLSPLLLELIFFCVAYNRSAPYCIEYHASNALRLTDKLDFNDLVELAKRNTNGVLPASYEAAIEVALELNENNCVLNQACVARLKQHDFDQLQIMELLTTVSISQLFSTYTMAADLPIDESIKVSNR